MREEWKQRLEARQKAKVEMCYLRYKKVQRKLNYVVRLCFHVLFFFCLPFVTTFHAHGNKIRFSGFELPVCNCDISCWFIFWECKPTENLIYVMNV